MSLAKESWAEFFKSDKWSGDYSIKEFESKNDKTCVKLRLMIFFVMIKIEVMYHIGI